MGLVSCFQAVETVVIQIPCACDSAAAAITCCPVYVFKHFDIYVYLHCRVDSTCMLGRQHQKLHPSHCLEMFAVFKIPTLYEIAEAVDMRSFTRKIGAAGLCTSGQWVMYPLHGYPAYCSRSVLTCLYNISAMIHKTQ